MTAFYATGFAADDFATARHLKLVAANCGKVSCCFRSKWDKTWHQYGIAFCITIHANVDATPTKQDTHELVPKFVRLGPTL